MNLVFVDTNYIVSSDVIIIIIIITINVLLFLNKPIIFYKLVVVSISKIIYDYSKVFVLKSLKIDILTMRYRNVATKPIDNICYLLIYGLHPLH